METIMTPELTRLIAEIRTSACINGVNAVAIEELLKDAICSVRNSAYDDGRVDGYADGYDVGYEDGHDYGHSEGYASGYDDGYAV